MYYNGERKRTGDVYVSYAQIWLYVYDSLEK